MTHNNTDPQRDTTGDWAGPHYNPYLMPATGPDRAAKKKQTSLKIGASICAALICFALGAGSTQARTVTAEGPERVVEKQVKVPTTPASCLEALSLAEQAFDLAADAMGQLQDRDLAGMNSTTADLKRLGPKLNAAKAECRSN